VRRRRAFTLIELLVVIGIMAILITLITYGVKSLLAGQREKATHVTMESLKNLITESQVTGGRGPQQLDAVFAVFYPPNTPPPYGVGAPLKINKEFGDSYTQATDRFPKWQSTGPSTPPLPTNAVAATQSVIQLLRAVPNNSKWISTLPTERLWLPKSPQVAADAPQIPLILDAWGNPIIYVPSDGLVGVTVSSTDASGNDVSVMTVRSRDKRGFWASAGPDGFFTDPDPSQAKRKPYGDDNVYSFDNQ
jgi:prepilin-type N-terminal cleavage/methylation domain-containing protein